MSLIKCLGKINLDESELEILDSHVQTFRKEGKSKKVAEKLAVTARLDEINQDMQDVQAQIDKAPKVDKESVKVVKEEDKVDKKTVKQQFEEKKTKRQEAKERAAKKIAERKKIAEEKKEPPKLSKTTTKPAVLTKQAVEKQLLNSRFAKPVRKMLDSDKLKIVQSESELPSNSIPIISDKTLAPQKLGDSTRSRINKLRDFLGPFAIKKHPDGSLMIPSDSSVTSPPMIADIVDIVALKSSINAAASKAKTIGELLNTPPFSILGLEILDAPSKRIVVDAMLSLSSDLKVRKAIIELIPVDMMNDFLGGKASAKMLLNNESVFQRTFSHNREALVSLASDVSFSGKIGVASHIAEAPLSSLDPRGDTIDGGSAKITVNFDTVLKEIGNTLLGTKEILTSGVRSVPSKSGVADSTIIDRHGVTPSSDAVLGGEGVAAPSLPNIVSQGISGAYYSDKDAVYLVADNLSEETLSGVFLHEIYHAKSKSILGDKQYRRLMQRLANLEKLGKNNPALDKHFKAAREAIPEDTPEADRLEEFAAYTLESYERAPKSLHKTLINWVKDFIAAIRVGLMRLGWMPKNVQPSDLSAIARASVRKFAETDAIGQAAPAFSQARPRPVFYSALFKAIEDLKQNTAPVGQWKAMISKLTQKGVKQDEINWLGVNEWLDSLEGKVTKEQILDFINANEVQVDDVTKGQGELNIVPNEEEPYILEVYRANDPDGEYAGTVGEIIINGEGLGNFKTPENKKYAVNVPTIKQKSFDTQKQAEEYIKANTDLAEETKHGGPSTTLPGAKEGTYRELVLTMPGQIEPYKPDTIHFTEEGGGTAIAWVRFNERVDADGNRVLFIEEIQSKRHQEGRQRGYKTDKIDESRIRKPTAKDREFYNIPEAEYPDAVLLRLDGGAWGFNVNRSDAETYLREHAAIEGVPNAPFKTTWPLLAMKRMIRYAAENGFDSIGWTTGEQQAARYDLSKHLDRIMYEAITDPANTYEITAYDENDNAVISEDEISIDRVEELFGKDIAEKIKNGEGEPRKDSAFRDWKTLSGLDLKVGGEGMKSFYDRMLPSMVNKYVKKWGGKVGETGIPGIGMAKDAVVGHDLVDDRWNVEDADGNFLEVFDTEAEANEYANNIDGQGEPVSVHALPITPEMREASMQGQPLFSKKAEDPFHAENRRIREEHKTLWHKAKLGLRRQLFPGGLLPDKVFTEKITRDSEFNVTEFDVKHQIGQLERAMKQEYGVSFTHLSDADSAMLNRALTGKVSDNIKPVTKVAIVSMRQYIDTLSQQYVTLLVKNEQELWKAAMRTGNEADIAKAEARAGLIDTITSNIGTYVHRSYRAFDDPKWHKNVPSDVLNDARKYLQDRYIEQGEIQEEADRLTEVTLNEILKNGTAYDHLEGFIKESKLGAKDLSILKKRKDIAPEIRELLGEYKDPRLNFAKSATKMSQLIWNHVFLENVKKEGMGVFLFEGMDRPPEATTQIAGDSSETYSPLNGLWTFPEIDQAFRDALGKEQMANWYRTIVQVNGFIKVGKTVLSPTTAMRNWQSAMFFALANGHFDFSHGKKSVSAWKEYWFHKGKGEKLDYLRKLQRLGVVYDNPYAGEMMRLLDDTQIIETMLSGTAQLKAKQAMNVAQKFYQFGDDFWKIIGFENEKRLLMEHGGLSLIAAEKEAAKRIRNTYPTYSMVGRFVKSLRRFPLAGTFVSFPAEIIRTSGNIIKYTARDMKNPKMRPIAMRRVAGLAIVSSFAAGLQALSKAWMDIDDEEEEAVRKLSAPWQRNSNLIFYGRDKEGRLRYVDISFLDPYNYFKRPFTAIMRDQPWEDKMAGILLDITSPFFGTDIAAGAIFEVLSNKKQGSGAQVYSEHDKPWSQTVDITNHLRKTLQPGIASNMERTWKAIDGQISPSGRKYTLADEGAAWLGWRASTFDPKVALYYRTFEFKDARSQAIRPLRRKMTSPNKVSDKALENAFNHSMDLRERAYTDMHQLVVAARKGGMDDKQIRTVLIGSAMTAKDREFIIKGNIPPWYPPASIMATSYKKSKALFDKETYEEFKLRFNKVLSLSKAHNKRIKDAEKAVISTDKKRKDEK